MPVNRIENANSAPVVARVEAKEEEQEAEPTFTCDNCGNDRPEVNANATDEGTRVCDTCHSEDYGRCNECNDLRHYDNLHSDDRDEGNFYCPSCYRNQHSVQYRSVTIPEEIAPSANGKIVQVARPFGIELEVRIDEKSDIVELSKELHQDIGVENDGSINGSGIEIQTPPLRGLNAERTIEGVCKQLDSFNGYVDSSCGYHLHVDCNDLESMSGNSQTSAVAGLWAFYIAYEDVIMSFLPPSRRKNTYCNPLRSDYHIKEILEAINMDRLEKIWYRARTQIMLNEAKREKKHGSRYRGINLHTLFSARHIEIRYHSGTINPKKILEWANLHAMIVERAIGRGFSHSRIAEGMKDMDIVTKTNSFFAMLNLAPSSEEYFRTRQRAFMSPLPTLSPQAEADSNKMLSEQEA